MKKLPILMILFIPAITIATTNRSLSDNARENDCRMYSEIANEIMKKKQSGYPVSNALEDNNLTFKKNKDEGLHRVVGMIISDAYDQPSYDNASINSMQLNEFTKKYYFGCLEL